MSLEITVVSNTADAMTLELTGAVDPLTYDRLDGFFADQCAGSQHVLIDMSGVRYVNSSGLGVLVKHAVALDERGGSMALLGIQPKVRIVVEMLGLEYVFSCVCERRPLAAAA